MTHDWKPPHVTYGTIKLSLSISFFTKMDHSQFSYLAPVSGVPGGLEPLLGVNMLVIEFAGVLDVDSFIKTSSEELLYSSHNNFECCDCTGESSREILLNDNYGRPVMQFIRVYDSCCRNTWSSETMIVQAPAGSEIGRITMTPGFFSSTFTIRDTAGHLLASFERDFTKLIGFAYDFTTPVAGGLLLHLGTMERSVGCSPIMNMRFDNVSDYRLKVLMIASAYMVLLLRRENRKS